MLLQLAIVMLKASGRDRKKKKHGVKRSDRSESSVDAAVFPTIWHVAANGINIQQEEICDKNSWVTVRMSMGTNRLHLGCKLGPLCMCGYEVILINTLF